jgi:hypothetical protein
MAVTRGRKLRMVKELAMFFAELGKVPDRKEYERMPNRPKFLNVKEVDRICKSWDIMLKMMKVEEPDLWELINKAPEPKKKPTITPKMDKAKTAKKAEKEGANGKSI